MVDSPLIPGVSSSREQQREAQALLAPLTTLCHCQNGFFLLFSLPFCQAGQYLSTLSSFPPCHTLEMPLGLFPPESSTLWAEISSACAMSESIVKFPPGLESFGLWSQQDFPGSSTGLGAAEQESSKTNPTLEKPAPLPLKLGRALIKSCWH